MEYTLSLDEIRRADVRQAGGKGASLGELIRIGMPVPSGFVVLASAYERFVKENDIRIDFALPALPDADTNAMAQAANEVRASILKAPEPRFLSEELRSRSSLLEGSYAVRSSATVEDGKTSSWAGQFETYLNAAEADLPCAVMKCWASQFTPHALLYRRKRGALTQPFSLAVIIQTMVPSEVSGTAFSLHPVTNDDVVVIEAVHGLGESLVSGQVTPDTYVIDKQTLQVTDLEQSEQRRGLYCASTGGTEWRELETARRDAPKLAPSDMVALAKLVLQIESHYGMPVDVEWSRTMAELYILQARPITATTVALT